MPLINQDFLETLFWNRPSRSEVSARPAPEVRESRTRNSTGETTGIKSTMMLDDANPGVPDYSCVRLDPECVCAVRHPAAWRTGDRPRERSGWTDGCGR